MLFFQHLAPALVLSDAARAESRPRRRGDGKDEFTRRGFCLVQYEFDSAYIANPAFAENEMFVATGQYVFALRLP